MVVLRSALPIVTRFAPSPNGSLHLGHAYSAIVAHDLAVAGGGRFLLRIEDIDGARSLADKPDEFRRDLEWLGLEWHEVPAQSTRLATYRQAAQALLARHLLYPCTCTRRDIEQAGAQNGLEGLIYPGTCKHRPPACATAAALRLDLGKARQEVGELVWEDQLRGAQRADPSAFGDVVLVRKDAPASYHLAATLDDAADGVTLVTRGADLFTATHLHRLLQALFDLPVPRWHHHALLVDESGGKLAKRRGSPSLAMRRAAGEDGRALAERLRQAQFPAGIALSTA